jgi:uncharacterized membrane protein YbhN (UPF0104 family)
MCDEQRGLSFMAAVGLSGLRRCLSRHGRNIVSVGLLIITLCLLVFLVAQEWDALLSFQWQLKPIYLVLALFCHSVSLFGTFVVWRLITTRLGSSASKQADFHIFFISLLARKIPSMIWYTGARSYLYKEEDISPSITLNAVALEFGVAILSGGWAYVLFQPGYTFAWNQAPVVVGIVSVAFLLTALLLARPQLFVELSRWLGRRWQKDIDLTVPNRSDIVVWSVIYLIAWIIGGLSLYFTIQALVPNGGPNWVNALGVANLATLVVLLNSVFPVGMGLKEFATGVLLTSWLPMPIGLVVAFAYRVLQICDELLWAGFAYLAKTRVTSDTPFE